MWGVHHPSCISADRSKSGSDDDSESNAASSHGSSSSSDNSSGNSSSSSSSSSRAEGYCHHGIAKAAMSLLDDQVIHSLT